MLKAEIHQGDHFIVEDVLLRHFECVGRTDQAGNDLFGRQARGFGSDLQIVNQLLFRAANEDGAFLAGFGNFGFDAGSRRNHVAIEHVIRQVLLKIIL